VPLEADGTPDTAFSLSPLSPGVGAQAALEAQMTGMVSRNRTVNGVPTSLRDLGYSDFGLDDAWQKCGSYGPQKYTYHDVNGRPVVDEGMFPDLKGMTNVAHSLNLTAGWYGNSACAWWPERGCSGR
jgi:hypothetical protein